MDHETATKILAACNSITKYFKASHICNSLLSESAKSLKIEGGGLKCFIKTRWTSMYEATYSFIRMRRALDEVVTNHPEEITNSTVKKYLKKQDFYDKVNTLAKLLRPIKNAILMLEGNQTNLADAFIQMIFIIAEGLRSGIYSLITSTAVLAVKGTLGWIYGKHRLHLQTSKVESMAKIRSFYISKVNEELKYASSKYSQKQHEIPNHIVSVLILENIFDINAVPFIKDPEDSDSDSDDDDESEDDDKNDNEIETENESEEELIMDYDVDELASKYLD
ncbi:unnamed protein product [Rhizophagus irregularis]|uniref:Uncharacterized protein n=1 Tax=Rhizophagus irregularis TaxID=588596 RepID=A0A916E5N5_9GLOM|nr:unnamed protein product [Rhizophagus irregularis]